MKYSCAIPLNKRLIIVINGIGVTVITYYTFFKIDNAIESYTETALFAGITNRITRDFI